VSTVKRSPRSGGSARQRVDLLVVGAAVESALNRVGEDHRPSGGDLRVDDAHLAAEVLRRQLRAPRTCPESFSERTTQRIRS
jgi:hypothetical protein